MIRYITVFVLGAIVGLGIMWLLRDHEQPPPTDHARFTADSIATAAKILERDCTIAIMDRDIDELILERMARKPTYIRVHDAEDHLRVAGADSLMHILDRDVPDPRQHN